MPLNFRIGNQVGPSGLNLAMVEIPRIDPESNLTLIDKSYLWNENISNTDAKTIESFVDSTGDLPPTTVSDFVISNITTISQQEPNLPAAPLYYRHICRFHHYSYGEDPLRQVYITDKNNNILKNINFKVTAEKIAANVYSVEVLTDFFNNEYVQYKVRYNKSDSDGSNIVQSWSELLNATALFKRGNPNLNLYEYSLTGPDSQNQYTAFVPVVPTISAYINETGSSFDTAPTFINGDPDTAVEYVADVRYTVKATGTATFSIERNKTYDGSALGTDVYLQAATSEVWGAAAQNLAVNVECTFNGVSLTVNNDNALLTNDQMYFIADISKYYLKPISYRTIYLAKPKASTVDEEWLVRVRAGSFTREMNAVGVVVPSGNGTEYQYKVEEYDTLPFSLTYGKPYIVANDESPIKLEDNKLQLKNTPLYIDPSSVFNGDGYPTEDYIAVLLNDTQIDQDNIIDWDIYNGQIQLSQTLTSKDIVKVSYHYEEKFYEYSGFLGSGAIYPNEGDHDWLPLDLNPTPLHSHGAFASGYSAHMFLSPSWDLNEGSFFNQKPLYHNYTGLPSGQYDMYLGSISLCENSRYTDVDITDTRTRGGGLDSKADLEKAKELQPESQFFWDDGYFDGKAFPSNGVLVITLPESERTREDEIAKKVRKHLALGEYPIIEFK